MKKTVLFTWISLCYLPFGNAQTLNALWDEYKANPYNHPNIPNNSYAGYGTGIVPLPNPSASPVNVTSSPYNAVPNDAGNDQPAIQSAIDAVGAAGGGIVLLPAGIYVLNKPLRIQYNNVIVRGEGSTGATATILDFKFSMYSAYKADINATEAQNLWWSTGLVWIGPPDSFEPNGAPASSVSYEQWRFSEIFASVTQPANPGAFSVTVNNAASLTPGMRVLLTYQLPTNKSFIKHIYGHAPTESGIDNKNYVGDCGNVMAPKLKYYTWPAYITSISNNIVTFDRPLRTKVDPALWPTTIRGIKSIITESGVEALQIKGYSTTRMSHLPTPTSTTTSGKATLGGWNGIYLSRSWNCWVNNVRFVNLESGVIFATSTNCSALNTFITSTDDAHWYHHPYAVRTFASDNLIENFTIDGPGSVRHGISTEQYSSGNVFSRGLLKVGTFDTHRALAFDVIRTEITVANDYGASSGGSASSGPYAGKRFAHWNITQKMEPGYPYENAGARSGENIFEPLQFPMSAFVGISGPRDNSAGEFVPPPLRGGNLGSVVVTGEITNPALINLYHAQLAFRIETSQPETQYLLILSTSGSGTISKSPDQATYLSGSAVSLTATPAAGQRFTGWSGDVTGTSNPLTVIMSADQEITASFAEAAFAISNITTVSGRNYQAGRLLVNTEIYTDRTYQATTVPANLNNAPFIKTPNADKSGTSAAIFSFSINGAAAVYIAYDPRSTVLPSWLSSWQKLQGQTIGVNDPYLSYMQLYRKNFPAGLVTLGGNLQSPAKGALNNYFVIVEPAASYSVEVSVSGNGSVTKNPDQPSYNGGASVVLTATPAAGQQFMGWGGDASGNANPLSITMNADKAVTAIFDVTTGYALTLSANGNGTISKSPSQFSYTSGSTVSLTAIPDAGQQFTGWSGNATGNANPQTVTMNSNKTIAANFTGTNFTVSNITAPSGRSYVAGRLLVNTTIYTDRTYKITAVPANLNNALFIKTPNADKSTTSASMFSFNLSGDAAVYIAYDPRGSVLPGWLSNWQKLTSQTIGVDDPYLSVMQLYKKDFPAGTVTVGGNLQSPAKGALNNYFVIIVPPAAYNLVITVSGSGGVTKSPDQLSYTSGSVVTLTATPAEGFQFTGWSSDAAGTNNPLTITIERAKNITANFNAINPVSRSEQISPAILSAARSVYSVALPHKAR